MRRKSKALKSHPKEEILWRQHLARTERVHPRHRLQRQHTGTMVELIGASLDGRNGVLVEIELELRCYHPGARAQIDLRVSRRYIRDASM